MGAAASVRIMMIPPSEGRLPLRGTRHLAFATRVCLTSTKRVSCRTETVASPRRIRKAHRAPSTRGALPRALLPLLFLIRLLRPRPAPASAANPSFPR